MTRHPRTFARAIARTLIALLPAAWLAGCSCSERIHVTNATNSMLRVQIQLPKPDAPWACGCDCVYEALLSPHAVWNSARPGSDDKMHHPPYAFVDCAIVRTQVEARGPWTDFTLCGELVDRSGGDPIMVTVAPGAAGALEATARTLSGKTVEVSTQVVNR